MLIAIMTDTFGEVMKRKDQSALNERIAILADFRLILMKMNLDMNFQYIYVVKPRVLSDEHDNLSGKLARIHESFDKTTSKILSE